MREFTKLKYVLFFIVSSMLLISCGGGSGGIEGTGLNGTAAIGAPLKDAEIIIKGREGLSVTVRTNDDGEFRAKIDELTAPYILQVKVSANEALFSVAQQAGTVNIHPVSDLLTRNWFSAAGKNIETEFAAQKFSTLPDLTKIDEIKNALEQLLLQAFNNYNVIADFDFMNSSFQANQQGFDEFLNNIILNIVDDKVDARLKDKTTGIEGIIIINPQLNIDFTKTDVEAPTEPTGLDLIPASDTNIILVWNSSTDNIGVVGYHIYRDDVRIETTSAPVFNSTELVASSQYCYTVEAFDGAGNLSAKSSLECATTLQESDTTAPQKVTGLTVTEKSNSLISLSWSPPSDNDIFGYDLYRKQNNDFTKISTVITTSFNNP